MRYLRNSINPALTVLLISSLFLSACARKLPPPAKTNVEEKFLASFNKTAKLDYPVYTTTRTVGKTLWIYIATDKDILTINSSSNKGGVLPEKNIKFLDITCQYENSAFDINYIFLKYSPEEKEKEKDLFKKTVGGTTLYQDFTNATIEILQKAYFSIGDIIRDTENMNFFAICLANIKNGIKITFVIHRLDMEQFLLNMLPSDEFYNRMILKADGSKDIINDKYGLHIEYNDILLVDFLREQIVNNAKAKINEMEKYGAERIKSLDKLDDIILKSIYEVVTKYKFSDFDLVEIQDLISKDRLSISRTRLLSKFSNPSPAYSLEDENPTSL